MFVVHRYPLNMGKNQADLPRGAQIIHFDYQKVRDQFSFWIVFDTTYCPGQVETRNFVLVPTAKPFSNMKTHIGSVVLEGFEIYHLFETALD